MTSETPVPGNISDQMLKDLQSWWEIPSIAQYISLFRESFNLPEIEIEELEKGLIDDSTKGPNSWLQNLILSLLRSLMPGRVNKENCEVQLQKLIARKWSADKENPYPEGKPFSELTLRSKVEIIYSVCLYRLDRNDITEVMKSMDADALRVQKLGIDDIGNTYWYFYGTRLYMEENFKNEKSWDEEWKKQKKQAFKKRGRGRPRKIQYNRKSDGESEDFEDVDAKNNGCMNVDSKSRWSVVCDTIEEWVSFAEKFKSSKSKNEKSLFQIVQENFLPTLNKIYEEKEKKLQQKIRELMPIREKIVTRRETRKLRGDAYESPIVNGYSDEVHRLHMVKDRARRLEERNKRASGTKYHDIVQRKRQRYSEKFDDSSRSIDSEPSQDSDECNYALTPKIDGLKMDLQSRMERLISSVKLHKDAWPFLYPVNEEDAPGYYEIIKDPIDLSTIDSRLHKGVYETVGELDAEFSQMVSNCELYNGENHDFSKMVQTLWKMFRKGVSKILDSLPPEENLNCVSEESSNNSDSPEYILKSPHIRKFKKDNYEKRREKKKRKRGMEALEMLAQASELAIKNTNSNDMLNELSMCDEQKKSNDFSDLKILPINSHPPSLIEKFSSESSNESVQTNDATYDNGSPYLNEAPNISGQFARSSPNEVPMPSSSESPNLLGNHLTQLTNFIEKHNVLTNSDVSNVLSDGNSSHTEHSSSPGAGFSKDSENSNNLDNGLDNILDCNENVSNILSQISKQMYNSENQLMSKDVNSSYLENVPKQDTNLSKNVRKTPPNSIAAAPTTTENMTLVQGVLNVQSDLGSPSSHVSTVDATVLGISQYSDLPKKLVNPCIPSVRTQDDFSNNEVHQNLVPGIAHERLIQKPIPSYQQSPQLSPNELFSSHQYGSSNLIPTNIPNTSYQSLNFDHTVPICKSQMTFSQPTTTTSNVPLLIPASYPKSARRQRSKIQLQPESNLMQAPTGGGQFVVVTDAGTESGVTYHLYTQSKMNQSSVEEHASYVPGRIAPTAVHVSPKPQTIVALSDNQESVNQSSPPQKKSPVPHQFQAVQHTLSPKSSPYSSPSTTSSFIKTSLPVTSSNFIPVNSFNISKSKPTIIRARAPQPIQTQNISTSFNASSNPNESFNTTSQNNSVFQAISSKTGSLVYSGYGQSAPSNQTDLRFSSNPGAMAVQSNICMSNGVPIVQQVLIPTGQQQIQVQGGGQFVFASPQNTVNRGFNSDSNQSVQNGVRHLNHGFAKVMPQIVTQNSMVQLSKDVVQGLQLQAVAHNGQAYTQVAQNPQFVNIPTYMITNQNQLQASVPQGMINMQQYQLPQRTQMQINGQGNG